MSVVIRKRRPGPKVEARKPFRRRFAEAPDRGECDKTRLEHPEIVEREAPDAGDAHPHFELSHGRCQS